MSARVEESGIICGERFFCSALYTCRSARVVIRSQPVHAVTFPSCDIRTATLTASERHAYASLVFSVQYLGTRTKCTPRPKTIFI